jgi:hypothetical protein
MAKVIGVPKLDMSVTFTVTEDEARALDALFGYDIEYFLKTFYEKMGQSYLQPHETGLRSLHNSRGFLSGELGRIDDARKAFNHARK